MPASRKLLVTIFLQVKRFISLFTILILCLPWNCFFNKSCVCWWDIIHGRCNRAESVDISKDGELIARGYRNFWLVIYQSNPR